MRALGCLAVGSGVAGDTGLGGKKLFAALSIAFGFERAVDGFLHAEGGDPGFGIPGGRGDLERCIGVVVVSYGGAGGEIFQRYFVAGQLRFHILDGGLGRLGEGGLEAGLNGVATAPFFADVVGAGGVWAGAPPTFGVAAFAMVQAHEGGEDGGIGILGGAGVKGGDDFVGMNVFQYTERGGALGAVERAEQGFDRLQRHQRPRGEVRDNGVGVGLVVGGGLIGFVALGRGGVRKDGGAGAGVSETAKADQGLRADAGVFAVQRIDEYILL